MASAAFGGDDEQARQAVEDERHQKEYETELNKRAQVQIAGCFRELVRNHSSNRITRSKKRSCDFWIVANDHGDGHRLAESTRQRQKHRTQNSGSGPRHDHLPGCFPARGAQSQRRFALFARYGQQHFSRNGDDERHDHDGQNDSSGEEAHSVVGALEKLAEDRNMAESVDQNRSNGRPHKWYDDKDSEKTIDHTG